MRISLTLALALAVTACQPISPTAAPLASISRQVLHAEDADAHDHATDYTPSSEVWTLPLAGPQGAPIAPIGATATTSRGCMTADKAIDGDPNSSWVNAELREGEAALTLSFAQKHQFRGIRLKTDPTAHGVTYKVMTSDDGRRWNPSSGRLVNLSWGMEPQEVAGEGRFLRLELFNHMTQPTSRFQVFELEVYGSVSPPGVSFPWLRD
jgi:hypothetical protein